MVFGDRITFDEAQQTMAVNFSGLTFETSADVDRMYDEIQAAVERTGRKWFFLINYRDSRVDLPARLTWQHRGKKLNTAWSLGSVRYEAAPDTRAELERRGATDPLYANLADSRDEAMALVARMREQMREKEAHAVARLEREREQEAWEKMAREGPLPTTLFSTRVRFDAETDTMEVDFGGFDFVNARLVDAFYDHLEHELATTARRWYFLVNLRGCTVRPEAWFQYARRGKALNLAFSLGSVRYNASPETADEIRRRADTEAFDPNLFSSREEAVARIAQMRASTRQPA